MKGDVRRGRGRGKRTRTRQPKVVRSKPEADFRDQTFCGVWGSDPGPTKVMLQLGSKGLGAAQPDDHCSQAGNKNTGH